MQGGVEQDIEDDDDNDEAIYIFNDVGGCDRFGLQRAGGCAE